MVFKPLVGQIYTFFVAIFICPQQQILADNSLYTKASRKPFF